MRCNYRVVVLFILMGFTIISGIGGILSRMVLGYLPIIPYLAPVSICMIMAGLVIVRDSITIQGGAKNFFCGGRYALVNFLRRRPSPPEVIYVDGPYSVSRHPVYSASIMIYLGMAIVFPWMFLSIWILLVWVYVASLVEEYHLIQSPAYRVYMSHTVRFNIIGVLVYGCKKVLGELVKSFSFSSQ